ncbi:hypothetical protein SEA_PEPE25_61 [Microbacterium phage Pepe25]|nr:hypothetical protein SEA_PEPE25_61 [Microbacterium phage Pepe25]
MAVIFSDQDLEAFGLREHADEIRSRFGIAQDGGEPSPEQLQVQATIREMIAEVGVYANSHITDGRNKSLALTALEDALMRFGKAVFEVPA